jgi:hypothetical protein
VRKRAFRGSKKRACSRLKKNRRKDNLWAPPTILRERRRGHQIA